MCNKSSSCPRERASPLAPRQAVLTAFADHSRTQTNRHSSEPPPDHQITRGKLLSNRKHGFSPARPRTALRPRASRTRLFAEGSSGSEPVRAAAALAARFGAVLTQTVGGGVHDPAERRGAAKGGRKRQQDRGRSFPG
ncbi:hypothetical protein FQA47_008466 [Oryzias melastigma]|uniref:Uncharacterized protein n=1 Tax=Oryzias melastigma TaxID=30732 RepID=A0A834CQF2_ORYME|nr:hypothetical protein FQA47_008466 [Oryzias melastigma]